MTVTRKLTAVEQYKCAKLKVCLLQASSLAESGLEQIEGLLESMNDDFKDLTVDDAVGIMVHAVRPDGDLRDLEVGLREMEGKFDDETVQIVCGCDAKREGIIEYVVKSLSRWKNDEAEESEE